VTQEPDGFVIVDQHALHERIIYEQLRSRLSAGTLESQKLLIPESFELTKSEAELLDSQSELLESLGIEIISFGPRTMAVQSFPSLLSKAEPVEFIRDFLDLLEQRGLELEAEGLLDDILKMGACKAAIKAGQKLSDSEIEQLLSEKEITSGSEHCPHGRPTTIKFTLGQLERQFKRS
jgi:DNA mismatch repair protein MutL